MKTAHYKGDEYRVVEDRGDKVVLGPMNARTPRRVVLKADLEAKPLKKKISIPKAKATKKRATKKAAAKK